MSSRPKRKRAWAKRRQEIARESLVRSLIQDLASGPQRSRFASSMVAPLRQRMDYQSLARRTFLVEELPLPKCGECGGYRGENASKGCRECAVGEVMDA